MTEPARAPRSERLDPAVDAGDGDGKGVYWLLKNVMVGPAVKRIFRPNVVGAENVPAHGAAIIASNHLSYADWIFMPLVLRRRVTFVAKSDYFTGAGLKGRFQRGFFKGTGQVPIDRSGGSASEGAMRAGIKGRFQRGFFKGTGQVPIDRSGGSASEGAMRAGMKVLERGELFGIYPEGTRSHDGRLYKGRTGVARLALEAKVPVIPCGVIGTDVVAPPGKVVASFASPTVKFGEPLDFSRYEGMESDRLILRAVTDEIMYKIMELSGQEYIDMYATKAKALEGRAVTGAPKKVRKTDT